MNEPELSLSLPGKKALVASQVVEVDYGDF